MSASSAAVPVRARNQVRSRAGALAGLVGAAGGVRGAARSGAGRGEGAGAGAEGAEGAEGSASGASPKAAAGTRLEAMSVKVSKGRPVASVTVWVTRHASSFQKAVRVRT